jgi:hypothetical protein
LGTLDLSKFLVGVRAVEDTVGRKTVSPRMKLTLWLNAAKEGIGTAREIARRIQTESLPVVDGGANALAKPPCNVAAT